MLKPLATGQPGEAAASQRPRGSHHHLERPAERRRPQVRRSAQLALDQNQSPEPEDELERAISDAKDRGLNTPWRPLLLRRLLKDDAWTVPVGGNKQPNCLITTRKPGICISDAIGCFMRWSTSN